MRTASRVKSLDLHAALDVEIKSVRTRFNWRKLRWEGSAVLSVEGTPSIHLFPGDTLTINHHITESH